MMYQWRRNKKYRGVLAGSIGVLLLTSTALANPSGGTVTYGNAAISHPNATTTQIDIAGNKAIINWNSFSIAQGELTNLNFASPGGNFSNVVLNRVTGNTPSALLGQLTSNGAVFLINPNGIVFGSSGRVNTTALFATTHNITDDQFKNFNPTRSSTDHWEMTLSEVPGTAGNIEVQSGAQLVLTGQGGVLALIGKSVAIAPGVVLRAPQGTIMAVAAKEMSLSQTGFGEHDLFNTSYKIGDGNNVVNNGLMSILDEAETQGGGSVNLIGNTITQNGTIKAGTSTDRVSRVIVVAANGIHATGTSNINADGLGGNRAGYVGMIAGGTLTVDDGAVINARGNTNNGGDILLSSNNLNIGQGAAINVQVTSQGSAGTITKAANGGGDINTGIEYAHIAVRPNGDKMILISDGTESLPPVLPQNIKQLAENKISTVNKPIASNTASPMAFGGVSSETRPAVVVAAPISDNTSGKSQSDSRTTLGVTADSQKQNSPSQNGSSQSGNNQSEPRSATGATADQQKQSSSSQDGSVQSSDNKTEKTGKDSEQKSE